MTRLHSHDQRDPEQIKADSFLYWMPEVERAEYLARCAARKEQFSKLE